MNRSMTRIGITGIVAVLLLGSVPTTQAAEVVYRETFSNGVGQTAVSSFGWNAWYGDATTPLAVAAPGASGVPATAQGSGGPSARVALAGGGYAFASDVNAGARAASAVADNSLGFITTPCMSGLYDVMVYTDEHVIDRSQYKLDSISFYATSTGTFTTSVHDAVYAILRIGNTWLATVDAVTPPPQVTSAGGTAFQGEAIELPIVLDAGGGSWRPLTAVLGQSLVLGQPQAGGLPDGDVTAFGLLWDLGPTSDRNTPRWDTFTVTATPAPEPASLLLLAAGCLWLGRWRRGRGTGK